MRLLRYVPSAAAAVLAIGAQAAWGQGADAVSDGGPSRCIPLNRVDRTEVIDDRTLIFHMRGGGIFLNYLERECPGLKREERFMYSPTGNRLCDVDTITVLEQWGFGLTRGFTCGLGDFHPISDLELADLKRLEEGQSAGSSRSGFDVVPVDPSELEDGADSRREDGDSAASAEAGAAADAASPGDADAAGADSSERGRRGAR